MIEFRNVSKSFKEKKILNQVHYTFNDTGFYVLLGESGVGKTTFLNILSTLDQDYKGQIFFNEKLLDKKKSCRQFLNQQVSYFHQDHLLFNHLTVMENLTLFHSSKSTSFSVWELLKEFHLDKFADKKVMQLSQGEKRRVALIRTLLKPANIYLFDEPTSFLDDENKRKVLEKLKALSKDFLVIVVTHDYDVLEYAETVLKLENGNFTLLKEAKEKKIRGWQAVRYQISLLNRSKIAIHHLLDFKKKSFFSVCILFLTFTFLFLSLVIKNFDIYEIEANTLVKNNSQIVFFDKSTSFSNEEIKFLSNSLNTEIFIGKKYFVNDNYLNFSYDYTTPIYYRYLNDTFTFYEITPTILDDETVLGSLPTKPNEILISSYLADLLIYYKDYQNYEDVLQNGILNFGEYSFKISGIYLQEVQEYDCFKTMTKPHLNLKESALYTAFYEEVMSFQNMIYVANNFVLKNDNVSYTTDRVYVKLSSKKEFLKAFNTHLEDMTYHTMYTVRVLSYQNELSFLSMLFQYISLFFILLYIVIVINYLFNTVSKYHKERKLFTINGFSSLKIFSIYFFEIVFLQFFALLFSFLFALGIMYFINLEVIKQVFFNFYPMFFTSNTLIQFLLIFIAGTFVSLLFLFFKVRKK